jgi:hypothetical protein
MSKVQISFLEKRAEAMTGAKMVPNEALKFLGQMSNRQKERELRLTIVR